MTTQSSVNLARQLKIVRRVLAFVGIMLALLALLADPLGLSDQSSFGTGQIMGLILGIAILLVAIIWNRIIKVYQMTAVILLNTLVILAIIEFSLIGFDYVSRWLNSRQFQEEQREIAGNDESYDLVQISLRSQNNRYEPYTIWRRRAFANEFINVDSDGLRITPDANCTDNAYTVFMFGGSTMWGHGVSDWETIPAFLQQGLEEEHDVVCVINFAESAYVATQNVITLMSQLQHQRIPDVVVFYSGVNEVIVTYREGTPDSHWHRQSVAERFERSDQPKVEVSLDRLLARTHTFQFISDLIPEPDQSDTVLGLAQTNEEPIVEPEAVTATSSLSDEIVEYHLNNYQLVQALSEFYGFDFYFFWQPVSFVESKPLTEAEVQLRDSEPDRLESLFQQTYDQMKTQSDGYSNLYYIADVFNATDDRIYLDFMHINGLGNEIVADTMLEIITLSSSR